MRARSTAPLICTGIYMESVGRGPAFRSLFIADSAFLIARSRDSTHVRLLAAPSTASPHGDEAERDKLAEKDGYGVRNDAGWTPQLVRLKTSPGLQQPASSRRTPLDSLAIVGNFRCLACDRD